MKNLFKISIIALLSIVITLPAQAQSWDQEPTQYGVKGGINFANYIGDAFDGDTQTRGNVGLYLNQEVNDYFSVQPEVNLSWTGAQEVSLPSGSGLVEGEIKQTYLQIPVLAKFQVPTNSGLKPNLFAGPALSFSIYEDYEFGSGIDPSLDPKDAEFGLQFGAGVELGNLNLDGRYHWGLTDAFDDIDAQNGAFMLSIGIGI